MPTDPTPKRTRGGARWGHAGRRSNTGVQGVSEVRRPGRAPQLSVAWRDADGRRRTTAWTFTEDNRHVILAQAAAHYVRHHVPAEPPADPGR